MNPLATDINFRNNLRAQLANELSGVYHELADLSEPPVPFSLARLLGSHVDRIPLSDRESALTGGAAMLMGQHPNPHRNWIPFRALTTPLSTRAMSTVPGSKGGYLLGTDVADTADVLRPWSVVASAGADLMVGLTEGVVIPRTATATTAVWFNENGTAPSESPPTIGNVSLAPRNALAFIKFSIQLIRQGVAVESYLRMQLLRAIGELLDKAYFAGAGGSEPLGLLQTTGIGTQSGAALAHAGILAMRKKVLDAGGIENQLQWVGTPTVQETIGARERAAGGGRFLWDSDGILGRPAYATKNAPTSGLICGDFSQSVIGIFGAGVRLDIDPSQDFNAGGLVARMILVCDVAFPQPAAFSVAATVT